MTKKETTTKTKTEKIKEEALDIENIEKEITLSLQKTAKELQEDLVTKIDEQIEYRIDKRLKEEEKKMTKRQTFKIVRLNIIILILLVVIGYLVYCLFEVDYFKFRQVTIVPPKTDVNNNREDETQNDDSTTDKSKEEEKLEKERLMKEKALKEYRYLVENLQIEDASIKELYEDNTTPSSMSNELKLKIAYKNLKDADMTKEDGITSFTKEALLDSAKKIFGEEITLKNETFIYNKSRFMFYNDAYVGFKEEEEKCDYVYEIIDVDVAKKDTLEFKVLIAKTNYQGSLLDFKDQIIDNEYKKDGLLSYKEKLNTYVFEFKSEGDRYTFKSVKIERQD